MGLGLPERAPLKLLEEVYEGRIRVLYHTALRVRGFGLGLRGCRHRTVRS